MIRSVEDIKKIILRKEYLFARFFHGHGSTKGRRPFEYIGADSTEELISNLEFLPEGLMIIHMSKSQGGLSHAMSEKIFVGEMVPEAQIISETTTPGAAKSLETLKNEMMVELRAELHLKSLERENERLKDQLQFNDKGSEKLASAGYNMLMMIMGGATPDPAVTQAMQGGSRFKGLNSEAPGQQSEPSAAQAPVGDTVDIPEDKRDELNAALFNIVKKFGYQDVINLGSNPIVLAGLYNQIQAAKTS